MTFLIAKKEFLTNLLSARFAIGFVLCLVLIPFSILINVDDYRGQLVQARVDRDAAEKTMTEVRVYSFLRPIVVFPPEPLAMFGRGISGQVGNQVRVKLGEPPLLAEGKTAARDNPFLASFFSVDFVDIAAIIFSLLALLFSYDALTREKEDGTLRLQMSNSVGRATLLAGKVAGILMTLLPILVFSFLLGALIIMFSGVHAFTAGEWGRLALLALVSLVYLAVFVFLGLFVSSRTKNSVTSLVLCLFLWVTFVFLMPNMASYAAESFVPIPSRDNLDAVLADMDGNLRRRIEDATKDLPEADWKLNWYMNGGADGERETYGCTAPFFERQRREMGISEPLRLDNADKKWGPQKAYLDGLSRQAGTAEKLSLISPAGLFRLISTVICGTDRGAQEKRLADVRRYRETFVGYLKGKNLFERFEYITPTPPSAFKTADALVEARTGGKFKTLAEYDAWAATQKDFRARWQVLYTVIQPGEKPDDYPFLKTDDVPRFMPRGPSLGEGWPRTSLRLGLLLVECVLLFALAAVSFIRYDVR